MISLKGLNKFFNKGKNNEIHVINDVTLDLPESGMCAIFGKSGCGKTTLLNVIGGLDGFTSGSLNIEGNSISTKTDDIRNKYIGYIFQNYNLNKNESCFDNIADALRLCGMKDEGEIERRVQVALRNVGMEKYAKRTPDTLSGGQQQRIAIARAIVKNPRIILADEPTGNLDEANTIMIMDLLSEIAKDHLVILVTHELNLVDAYCNRIIEISDGQVVDVREGKADGSFYHRNKQDIYLGELEKRDISSPGISLEYYGDTPDEPIKIKVVNKDGRLYLQLGTERVHVIDGTGEVRLVDGVYEKGEGSEKKSHINMEDLPEVKGEKFGSLFTVKSSLKSGYKANFVGSKKGKKALRRVLILFALSFVFMSAIFGKAIGNLINVSDSYNHNIFYVYNKESRVSEILNSAVGDPDSAIDEIRLTPYYPEGENMISFASTAFETFSQNGYSAGNYVKAAILSTKLCEGRDILEGSGEIPSGEFILISDVTADDIIESSPLGYIDEYSDLIGLTSTMYKVNGKNLCIGGVVKTGERAVYLSEMTLASYVMQFYGGSAVNSATKFDLEVESGKAIIVLTNNVVGEYKIPAIGEKIKISGMSLEVADVIKHYEEYSDWLRAKSIVKQSRKDFFESLIKEQNPSLKAGSDEYKAVFDKLYDEKYFEYDDYYYQELDRYIREMQIVFPDDFNLWLYVEKGISEVKYTYCSSEYVVAQAFKSKYGRYPTATEYGLNDEENAIPSFGSVKPERYVDYEKYFAMYESEFYLGDREKIYSNTCLISEADFINMSKCFGETNEVFEVYGATHLYTAIHSTDAETTERWLNEKFGSITDDYYDMVITPSDMFDSIISISGDSITGLVVAMVVMILIMSVCMFFIMRASMMNRIKEIGIYRAIGVSKRNLIFRFALESFVLSALTIVVGYLLTSGFIWLCLASSPLVETMFFYPVWYSLMVLAFLLFLSIMSGILPLLSLLRKTPSEILAKYDI